MAAAQFGERLLLGVTSGGLAAEQELGRKQAGELVGGGVEQMALLVQHGGSSVTCGAVPGTA